MLDTDIASYLLKGRAPGVEARLRGMRPGDLCISVMTRAEIQFGLQRLAPEHRLHIAVQQLFRMIRVLPWDAEAADWFARLRHQLDTIGQPIGLFDLMIAAHALATGATLVTNNERHFRRLRAPLLVENWS